VPVTVKMRSGWDNDNIVSTEAGVRLEKIGVSAITLHPRTTNQQFSGKSNWNLITELKEAVNIPVIGNGDVMNYNDYLMLRMKTKCDGVMIGRAALGNPWIFQDIINCQTDVENKKPKVSDIVKMCSRHFNLLSEDKNEKVCVNLAKKHFSFYLKGFNGASKWRKAIMHAICAEEIQILLENMEKEFSH